jgi:hypothetical protein
VEAKGAPMSPEKDFDINAWESGKFYDIDKVPTSAPSTDFDVSAWEKGSGGKFYDIDNLNPAPTSVEGRPGVPKPQPPTLSPSEEMPVSQAEQDSVGAAQTAKQLGGPAAGGLAAGMAGPMVMALAPEAVQALASAAAAHPIAAKVIAHGLEAAGLGAGWKVATKLFGK